MGIGYTRQSSADIVDGLPITAAPLNNEFNAIRDAFGQTDGHSHDGTLGEGPKINLTTSVVELLPVASGGTGASDIAGIKQTLSINNVDNTSDADKPISTATQQALNLKANIDSPTLTGTPAAPTAANATNTTQIATTAHVKNVLVNGATLGSTWTVPKAALNTNNNSIASTSFVQDASSPKVNRSGDTMLGRLSFTPGTLGILTGGTTAVDYNTSNRRRFELRSGDNSFNISNIPESGGDLELDLLYTAGTLAFAQTIRWKLGAGDESTNLGDTGIVLTAGVRYAVVLWNMGGTLYGVIG